MISLLWENQTTHNRTVVLFVKRDSFKNTQEKRKLALWRGISARLPLCMQAIRQPCPGRAIWAKDRTRKRFWLTFSIIIRILQSMLSAAGHDIASGNRLSWSVRKLDSFRRSMNAGEEVCHAYRNGTAIGQGCPWTERNQKRDDSAEGAACCQSRPKNQRLSFKIYNINDIIEFKTFRRYTVKISSLILQNRKTGGNAE